MEIGATSHSAMLTARDGLSNIQTRVADDAGKLAGGDLDPAVVVDLKVDKLAFSANVAVIQASDSMTKKLLDTLA
jgi:flagellar basal body rod protein FlgC